MGAVSAWALANRAERQRVYRAVRKAQGLCTDCANTPAVPGKTHCAKHLAKINAWWPARPAQARAHQSGIRARRTARTDAEIAADRQRLRPDGLKWCKKRADHDAPSPVAEFSNERGNADGLRSLCKLCDNDGIRRIAEAYWAANSIPLECAYCPGPYEEIDHVTSRRRGGTNDPVNLMPSCFACNNSKRAKPVGAWLCAA